MTTITTKYSIGDKLRVYVESIGKIVTVKVVSIEIKIGKTNDDVRYRGEPVRMKIGSVLFDAKKVKELVEEKRRSSIWTR